MPFEAIVDEAQLYGAADATVPPPEELPVNDSIKGLDEWTVKIMIDPGHFSNYNQSPVYSPYWESIMTWKLSNYLQKELQALGAHADLTKQSLDEDPELNDRGFCSKGYDFFISIHSNAASYSYIDSPLALVHQDLPWTDIDDISRDMGTILGNKVAEVMQTNQKAEIWARKGTDDHDRNGVMDDEWYSVLFGSRYVGTPGILLEHSYHTNYRATIWLYNDNNLKKLAKEEAALIFKYFTEKKEHEFSMTTAVVSSVNTETSSTVVTTTTDSSQSSVKPALGDVNGDGVIDSSDASCVLEEYALISTGSQGAFGGVKMAAADINADGAVDSSDASLILEFYAFLSVGGEKADMSSWLKEKDF